MVLLMSSGRWWATPLVDFRQPRSLNFRSWLRMPDPVETPADLQGMKIRGGSRLANKLLEVTGATPVGMPVPAVPEGLSKGVIDGTTIPMLMGRLARLPLSLATTSSRLMQPVQNPTGYLSLSRSTRNGLPT